MDVESLAGLKAAFNEWRSKKRHVREAIPAGLLVRARAAAQRYGPAAVARATRLDRARLKTGWCSGSRGGTGVPATSVPMFSRVELAAPAGPTRPFAEVEMPTGLKVRLFAQSDEALGLLSSLLGAGGAR